MTSDIWTNRILDEYSLLENLVIICFLDNYIILIYSLTFVFLDNYISILVSYIVPHTIVNPVMFLA